MTSGGWRSVIIQGGPRPPKEIRCSFCGKREHEVAKVIAGAVSARHPRARYLVGYDAQALAVAERLSPTTIKDKVTRVVLGL